MEMRRLPTTLGKRFAHSWLHDAVDQDMQTVDCEENAR